MAVAAETTPRAARTRSRTKTQPVVTLWAWYPNMETVVDNFNEEHDDVQVCWTNAGAGGDAYDKFQTAISAGSGAPDVMMVEADRIADLPGAGRARRSDATSAMRMSRTTSARARGRTSRSAMPSTALRSTAARWA